MSERLLGTRCCTVGVCLRLSLLISSKGQRVPERRRRGKKTFKNKLKLRLHSQEESLKAAFGVPARQIISNISNLRYSAELSVCSQVSESRAGRRDSGHSWRIHLSFGVLSRHPGRIQRAVPSERLKKLLQLEM